MNTKYTNIDALNEVDKLHSGANSEQVINIVIEEILKNTTAADIWYNQFLESNCELIQLYQKDAELLNPYLKPEELAAKNSDCLEYKKKCISSLTEIFNLVGTEIDNSLRSLYAEALNKITHEAPKDVSPLYLTALNRELNNKDKNYLAAKSLKKVNSEFHPIQGIDNMIKAYDQLSDIAFQIKNKTKNQKEHKQEYEASK